MRIQFLYYFYLDFLPVATHKFAWLSDIHLDLLYDERIGQRFQCRNDSSVPQIEEQLQRILQRRALARFVDWQHFSYPNASNIGSCIKKREMTLASVNVVVTDSKPILPAYHGRYGCDSPLSLMWASLLKLKSQIKRSRVGFVLITGDLVAHYEKKSSARFRLASFIVSSEVILRVLLDQSESSRELLPVENQTQFLDQIFTLLPSESLNVSQQIIFCPGNNDVPIDYFAQVNSPWNRIVYETWKDVAVPRDQRKTFLKGLYYTTLLKAEPQVRVVCLNTNWWSIMGRRLVSDEADNDPADQFMWLEDQLKMARSNNEEIMLVGHIPPAHSFYKDGFQGFTIESQWEDQYNRRYFDLLQRYRDVIRSQLFGHFHTDEFRLQMQSEHSRKSVEPVGLVLIAPGISPNHGTNPAWRIVTHDGADVRDYTQYYTRLYGEMNAHHPHLGTWDSRKLPQFYKEYVATKRFAVSRLSARSLYESLVNRLANEDSSAWLYWQLKQVQATSPPMFLIKCVIEVNYEPNEIQKCAERYIDEEEKILYQ